MDFIFDKEQLRELNQTITLFKKFDRYKHNSKEELYYHLLPSFKLGQYKTIKEDGNVIGFANWALLNKDSETRYKSTALLNSEDWQSGLRVWLIDIVCAKDTKRLMKWIVNFFKKFLLKGEKINWLKLDDNFNIIRHGSYER